MTAAAGSLVLLCIATGQFEKRSRIFEKKNIYYNFFYFIFIQSLNCKRSTKEVSVAGIPTRSKFGSNSIFAMCHFIVGLKSEVE